MNNFLKNAIGVVALLAGMAGFMVWSVDIAIEEQHGVSYQETR